MRPRTVLLSMGLIGAVTACRGRQAAQDTTIALSPELTQAPPAPVWKLPRVVEIGRELLLNGDAEARNGGTACALGARGRLIGWSPDSALGVAAYAASPDAPTDSSAAPPVRGACYFRAALSASDSVRSAWQQIDLTALADTIDSGHAAFALAGWMSSRIDGGTARLSVAFSDALGHALSGAYTAIDAVNTPNDKGLYLREAHGPVPPQARSARVTISFLRNPRACPFCAVTSFADELSFVVTRR